MEGHAYRGAVAVGDDLDVVHQVMDQKQAAAPFAQRIGRGCQIEYCGVETAAVITDIYAEFLIGYSNGNGNLAFASAGVFDCVAHGLLSAEQDRAAGAVFDSVKLKVVRKRVPQLLSSRFPRRKRAAERDARSLAAFTAGWGSPEAQPWDGSRRCTWQGKGPC